MNPTSSVETLNPDKSFYSHLRDFYHSPITQSIFNSFGISSVLMAKMTNITTTRWGKYATYTVSCTTALNSVYKNVYLDLAKRNGALEQHNKILNVWTTCLDKIKAEVIDPSEPNPSDAVDTSNTPNASQVTAGGQDPKTNFKKQLQLCKKLLEQIKDAFSSVEFQAGTEYSKLWEQFTKQFDILMDQHHNAITNIKNQVTTLTTEKNAAIEAKNTSKDQYEIVKDDRDNLSTQVQEGIEARAHLEADLRAVRKSERTLRLQMEDVVKAKAKLEEQSKATIANLQEELKAATTSKGEAKRELDESRMKLEEQSILLKSLDAQIKQQQKQIEILEEQNRLLQSVNKSFGEKFAKLEADNVALKADNAELKVDNAALKADNAKMAENFAKLQSTFEQFRKEVMSDFLKKMDTDKRSRSPSVNQNP